MQPLYYFTTNGWQFDILIVSRPRPATGNFGILAFD